MYIPQSNNQLLFCRIKHFYIFHCVACDNFSKKLRWNKNNEYITLPLYSFSVEHLWNDFVVIQ